MSSSVSGKALDLHLLWKLLSYARPYRKVFVLASVITLIVGALAPVRPLLIRFTFDNYIVIPDAEGLLFMTLLMIALLVVQAVFEFLQEYLASWLGQTVVKDLRVQLFRHIAGFRLRYYDRTPIGTLVTRSVSDMEAIAETFSDGLLVIIGDILQLLMIIAAMLYMSWDLTLYSLSVMPLLLLSTWIFKNGIRSTFQEVRTQVARLNAFVQEHIVGMSVVQIFNREEAEMQRFRDINRDHTRAHIRSVWYYSIFLPVVEILSAVSIGLMVWWGAREAITAIDGSITLGMMLAFIFFIYALFRPIRQLADKFNTLQMGMVASERVFNILDTKEAIYDGGRRDASAVRGDITFRDVWFAYSGEDWVLNGVSLEAKAGQTLALVGATGAGKTSLINVLGRFYEYNKGRIELDGADIREYRLGELRKSIAVVLQDVFLFSDTVYNNITLNDDSISRDRVEEAARIVGAHDFIRKLSGGYDYNVRERGGMLSAGQRQLIAFIRAWIHNPKILVLDEATSSVDTESEQTIQHALGKLTENRTSVIIAHRLATIQRADNIVVMDKGRVVESGRHDELLAAGGYYRRLYEIQFRDVAV